MANPSATYVALTRNYPAIYTFVWNFILKGDF